MKDDFSQDKRNPSNKNLKENSLSVNDDSLDWAKQAYLELKQKQQEVKDLREKEIKENEILNNKNKIKEDFKSNISFEDNLQSDKDSKDEEDPKLGDFDDTFTWSAEVLAAQ